MTPTNTILPQKSDRVYLVRDDSCYCTTRRVKVFVERFCDLLQKYTETQVIRVDAKKQIDDVKLFFENKHKHNQFLKNNYNLTPYKIVSLDKWYEGDYQINVSRVFQLNSEQKSPIGFKLEFPDNFLEVYGKTVTLVDDDIASGATIRYVTEYLKEFHIKVDAVYSMSQIYHYSDLVVEDYIDIRDFIPNAKHGGLLCWVDNTHKRFPYLHPYVNLCNRMKLSENGAICFTSELKKLIFEELDYVC